MKVKKLLALLLSAVMAVSMLTACGGGGGGTEKKFVDLDKVNKRVSSSVSDVTVEEWADLEKGMAAVENMVSQTNRADITLSMVQSTLSRYVDLESHLPRILATSGNFTSDINSVIADYVIENAEKSAEGVFYASAIQTQTKDGYPYVVYVVAAK